ncbi:TPA: hypothetical protein DDW35_08475 [Candidatus Sumerlaeota bacterium]|jgi:signal transduction histidine kinase|nr:hypothetical protein [Candidatus Sumerlaeota bacterium]
MILHRLPLGARIAFFVFLAELFLLGGFSGGIFYYYRERFQMLFDEALHANASAIGAFLEQDDESNQIGIELSAERENRFHKNKRPDIFAVQDEAGNILFSSPANLKVPPVFSPKSGKKVQFSGLRHQHYAYRGVYLKRSMKQNGTPVECWIFFATSTRTLEKNQREIARGLSWAVGLLLIISVPLAWGVSYKGLRPLRRVAQDISDRRESSLYRRLNVEDLPRDLNPLVRSVNFLLKHLEGAFEREKQFSADAAHELRTPISTLKAGVQAALLSPRNAQEDTEMLEDLLADVNRLERLCESLLLIASAEREALAETQVLSEWLADVKEIVEEFQPRAEAAEHHLKMDIDALAFPTETRVVANNLLTRRIAVNFLENALRHGGPMVHVQVGISEGETRQVYFAVEDNGSGIAPADEAQLFKRFFRSDRARSQATGGAGLGLAICRAVAESAGGSIHYERSESGGSRFVWMLGRA